MQADGEEDDIETTRIVPAESFQPSGSTTKKVRAAGVEGYQPAGVPFPRIPDVDGLPAKAVEYWHHHITASPNYNADVECVVVLVLSTRLRIKGHYLVSVGSLNEAMAHPREVFRIAIMVAAHAIVLMHNHPSGDSSPSPADTSLTRRVREAGELLRIELCDHIIVGHQRYFSFKESCII